VWLFEFIKDHHEFQILSHFRIRKPPVFSIYLKKNHIQRTANSGYVRTLKESAMFIKEPPLKLWFYGCLFDFSKQV